MSVTLTLALAFEGIAYLSKGLGYMASSDQSPEERKAFKEFLALPTPIDILYSASKSLREKQF